MAIKDLLVYADDSAAVSERLDVAAKLAQSHDAHLTGLYVIPPPYFPVYAEIQVPMEVLQEQTEIAQANAKKAENIFTTIAEKHDIETEWRCDEGDLLSTLNMHARYVDLVVLGQDNPDEAHYVPAGIPDKVILGCGRPVLFIPYIDPPAAVGQHVLIAWNGKREAARAVNDAIPLLTKAKEVKVLAVNPKSGPDAHGEIPSADICLHLARHGVNVEAMQITAKEIDVGNILLSSAADTGADLIVMGGYGHTRLWEVVLSGATRHLLKHMTVPVLMSH